MARAFKLVGLTGEHRLGQIDRRAPVRRARHPGHRRRRAGCARWRRPASPPHADIAAAWPEVVAPDGGIDRKRLGEIVFADPAARERLEAITHPRIQALSRARAAALADAGHALALYEASLLVESGRYKELDGLIVVTASPATQTRARRRPRRRDARTRSAPACARSCPQEDKVRVATHVIDNDGDLAATEAQVDRIIAELRS